MHLLGVKPIATIPTPVVPVTAVAIPIITTPTDSYERAPATAIRKETTPPRTPHFTYITDEDYAFLVPNEKHPMRAKPILKKAPKGSLLTVGTERALFHASMMPKLQDVIAVDCAEEAVRFHFINNNLLKATPKGERALYHEFRTSPNSERWKKTILKARQKHLLTPQETSAMIDDQTLAWWVSKVVLNLNWNNLYNFKRTFFKGVNYVLDDNVFDAVQEIALRNAYHTGLVDLGDLQQVEYLIRQLNFLGQTISVFDMSNAWEDEFPNSYLGVLKTAALLERMASVMHPDGIVLWTKGKRPMLGAGPDIFYTGFRIKEIIDFAQKTSSWSGTVIGYQRTVQAMIFLVTKRHEEAQDIPKSRIVSLSDLRV